jgi:hypothetical protein
MMIENEISMMNFENDEVCKEIILLKLSLSRFVEIFYFFGGSILKYLDIIVTKEFTFPYFCVFCSSLCPSLNNTVICDFEKKYFCLKGTNFKTFDSMSFEIFNDGIDCDLFSSNFYEGMKNDRSVEMMISLYSSESLIEMKLFPYSIIGKNEIGFIMKEKEKKREEAEFSMERENESIGSEMNYFREILQLSGGSFWEGIFSVRYLKSNGCFEIDSSVENIEVNDFFHWGSLKAIIFQSGSHLRKIDGFHRCTSLCRIEIPSSVEVIGDFGFCECTSLNEVIFSSESHLREMKGFQHCVSLCRIEIPSSVEVIELSGFSGCTSLSEVIFSSESHLRVIGGFGECTSLSRVEIPASVEMTNFWSFYGCTSLSEVSFPVDSHLKEINGFINCTSLCRIEIPSSVEVIGENGLSGCKSLHVVTIRAGCRMRGSKGLRNIRSFIVHESDLKDNRRLVHLGV